MSINKQFLKSNPVCKVTLNLPKKAAQGANKVNVVGDFNSWDEQKTPMEKLKNGNFKVILELETGKEYQYRYLLDGKTWENDWEADKYVNSGVSEENNSVIIL
jgi:1,4-alpha-glucan branching enzyme